MAFHPLAYARARSKAQTVIARTKGFGPVKAALKVDSVWKNALLDQAVTAAAVTDPSVTPAAAAAFSPPAPETADGKAGKLGDGAIINLIVDFWKSDQGKAVLDALVKLLLNLIKV